MAKGWLFLVLGILAATGLIATVPRWDIAILGAIAIWAFCRWYYFMFYVVEHYVDGSFRYAGLGAFLLYLYRSRSRRQP